MNSFKLFIDKLEQYEQFLFNNSSFFLIQNSKLITIRYLFRTYVYQIDQQQIDKIPLETTLLLSLLLLNFAFEKEYFFLELISLLIY
ncbi:unnamed protein product [Rotaria sp. Silwood2]|nr:unnamed protein product [Rotaria sp. Silwood2]CAF3379464.1 unnamed protein product [Rotaria sp. Silwood2]CAF4256597.1 unnamed protein product [Rotaria sp. Silwood2]CAF4418981.1 unnamed protein product [Rotaria sp. Silwood2]